MNDTNALTIPPALLSDADNGIGNGTEATPKDQVHSSYPPHVHVPRFV